MILLCFFDSMSDAIFRDEPHQKQGVGFFKLSLIWKNLHHSGPAQYRTVVYL